MGPRSGLDAVEKMQISCPSQKSNPGSLVDQSVAIHYADKATSVNLPISRNCNLWHVITLKSGCITFRKVRILRGLTYQTTRVRQTQAEKFGKETGTHSRDKSGYADACMPLPSNQFPLRGIPALSKILRIRRLSNKLFQHKSWKQEPGGWRWGPEGKRSIPCEINCNSTRLREKNLVTLRNDSPWNLFASFWLLHIPTRD
jgi:hypothetical protein